MSMFSHSPGFTYQTILEKLQQQVQQQEEEINRLSKIKNELLNSFSLLSFKSPIIEEYYEEVCIYHSKINLKNSMRMILIFWHFSLALNVIFSPGFNFATLIGMLCLIFVLCCYSISMFLVSYSIISNLTFLMLLVSYIGNLLTQDAMFSLVETNFTPGLQINILMFAILPVSFSVAINVCLINFSFIITLSVFMIDRKKLIPDLNKYLSELSLFKSLREFPLFSNTYNVTKYSIVLVISMLAMLMLSMYLFFINNLRRRSAFATLGRNVNAKRQIKLTMKDQLRWIDAIMPAIVKTEYWAHNDEIKLDKWIYIKTFENVSILFADIVGFTNMSSNKSAIEVVMLLNDLFNRFDDMCSLTNCEKLGTLGDCYYCVAGCPIPRPDHAVCCIEMGLGMCRIIEQFNKDHKENVNMRVGVHTGRVNAAIIGKKRFKFDVYSNDVIIANSLESSGSPGRVHISQSCYEFVRNTYKVCQGTGLQIKREEKQGIAGSLLKMSFMKTYFVDPHSSHFAMNQKLVSNQPDFSVMSQERQTRMSSRRMSMRRFSSRRLQSPTGTRNLAQENLEDCFTFIQGLRYDPDQLVDLFSELPVNEFTLMFNDRELEWHYLVHTLEDTVDVAIESKKSSLILDCTTSTIYTVIIYIELFILFPSPNKFVLMVISIHILILLFFIFVSGWYSYSSYSKLKNRMERIIFKFLSKTFVRGFFCLFYQSSTVSTVLLLYYDCEKLYLDYSYTINFFVIVFFSLFAIPLYFSTHYLIKLISTTIVFGVIIFLFYKAPCKLMTSIYTFPRYSCLGVQNFTEINFINRIRFGFIVQIFIVYLLSILLIREMERNVRLWFFVSREAEICREEAQNAMKNAEKILYNIIPKYVFDHLMKKRKGKDPDTINFNYAVTIQSCAVIFACISNFFSQYYREDYKGGENALRLLHQIITSFDNIMEKKRYKDVEKIKTINDCYMVASGLNSIETKKNTSKDAHLIALMHYGFDLIKTLNEFNTNYIIGSDKFEIKIGYNFGPVTAGIIGATKPMYDIWGDTVNVASRMYSTGAPGMIQAPHYVERTLVKYFSFKYRGKIFVKGKGDMITYICFKQKPPRNSKSQELSLKKKRQSSAFLGFTMLEFSE